MMRKYTHKFTVDAPLADVVEFHSRSDSMGTITPPPLVVQVHSAPPTLADGDTMDFTLWAGPFPIRWVAEIEKSTPDSFIDRQVRGPFLRWEHSHTFVSVAENQTEIQDDIVAELKPHWFWKSIGFGMWSNMPLLFAYRSWKTRKVLRERQQRRVEQEDVAHHG